MKYVKKPIVVEAFQFGVDKEPEWFVNSSVLIRDSYCSMPTHEGLMNAYIGDMIIQGTKGEIYLCEKDIFDATYELESMAEGTCEPISH